MKTKILLIALLSVTSLVFNTNCGGSGVTLEETGGSPVDRAEEQAGDTTPDCPDTGNSVTTGDITAAISGEPCNAPSPSSVIDGILLLGCGTPSERTASDLSVDYATVTCGTGEGAATALYYCSDGIVYKNNDSIVLEIAETATIECVIDAEDNATISEEEFIQD